MTNCIRFERMGLLPMHALIVRSATIVFRRCKQQCDCLYRVLFLYHAASHEPRHTDAPLPMLPSSLAVLIAQSCAANKWLYQYRDRSSAQQEHEFSVCALIVVDTFR